MSYWQLGTRTIANAQKLSVTGRRTLRGLELTAQLVVTTVATPQQQAGRRIDIVPCFAEIEARLAGQTFALGKWQAPAWTVAVTDGGGSTIPFTSEWSADDLRRLEEARSGGLVTLWGVFWAEVYVDGSRAHNATSLVYSAALNRDDWLAMLNGLELFEAIAIEVPLYAHLPSDLVQAQQHIRHASDARQRGGRGHIEAIAECRKSLDAVRQAGFSSKTPADVQAFLMENAGKLTLAERRAVLLAALKMYFSPAHHAGSGAEQYSPLDSAFALATSASLIQMLAQDLPGLTSAVE